MYIYIYVTRSIKKHIHLLHIYVMFFFVCSWWSWWFVQKTFHKFGPFLSAARRCFSHSERGVLAIDLIKNSWRIPLKEHKRFPKVEISKCKVSSWSLTTYCKICKPPPKKKTYTHTHVILLLHEIFLKPESHWTFQDHLDLFWVKRPPLDRRFPPHPSGQICSSTPNLKVYGDI